MLPDADGGRGERRAVLALDVAALIVTIGLLSVAAADLRGPVRVLLALVFVSFVPGWAVLDHAPMAGGWSRVALSVAISLSMCTAAASALAWAGRWQPSVLLNVLGVASILAVVSHLVRRT